MPSNRFIGRLSHEGTYFGRIGVGTDVVFSQRPIYIIHGKRQNPAHFPRTIARYSHLDPVSGKPVFGFARRTPCGPVPPWPFYVVTVCPYPPATCTLKVVTFTGAGPYAGVPLAGHTFTLTYGAAPLTGGPGLAGGIYWTTGAVLGPGGYTYQFTLSGYTSWSGGGLFYLSGGGVATGYVGPSALANYIQCAKPSDYPTITDTPGAFYWFQISILDGGGAGGAFGGGTFEVY